MTEDKAEAKYVSCMRCNYVMPWIQHERLVCKMDCPRCAAPSQFGPGVYILDFEGYSLEKVMARKYRGEV